MAPALSLVSCEEREVTALTDSDDPGADDRRNAMDELATRISPRADASNSLLWLLLAPLLLMARGLGGWGELLEEKLNELVMARGEGEEGAGMG